MDLRERQASFWVGKTGRTSFLNSRTNKQMKMMIVCAHNTTIRKQLFCLLQCKCSVPDEIQLNTDEMNVQIVNFYIYKPTDNSTSGWNQELVKPYFFFFGIIASESTAKLQSHQFLSPAFRLVLKKLCGCFFCFRKCNSVQNVVLWHGGGHWIVRDSQIPPCVFIFWPSKS